MSNGEILTKENYNYLCYVCFYDVIMHR